MFVRRRLTPNHHPPGLGLGTVRLAVLATTGGLGFAFAMVVVAASISDHDTLRWIAIFGVALTVLAGGLTLWTPNLTEKADREKVGLALLAGSLFFGGGAFMTLQAEQVSEKTSSQEIQAERGFELAAERRRLIVELGVRRDLTGIDLRGRDLSGAALRNRTLSRALLNAANMQDTDLTGANLRGALLVRTRLAQATLNGADLRGANLSQARLAGADLRGADLRAAHGLETAILDGAVADATTRWPRIDGFGPKAGGVLCAGGDCGTAPLA